MKQILLTIEYDGSAYHGWQRQVNAITIEEEIQKSLTKIFLQPIKIKACSRTDAGVHAFAQLATILIPDHIENDKLQRSLNSLLPDDISIISINDCSPHFNLRKEHNGKQYRYQINNSSFPKALDQKKFWWVPKPLNKFSMEKAAEQMLGTHDFIAFRAKNCPQHYTIKNIQLIKFDWKNNANYQDLIITIKGSGFLRNMVRIMVGTLVYIGLNRLPIDNINKAFVDKKRELLGITAPSHGLFLEKIFLT